MKRISKLILASLFVSILWVQAFHRHSAHEGGMSAPHTDCVVCAWAQGSHVSYLSTAHASVASGLAALGLLTVSGRLVPHNLLTTSDSRAPPLA